MVYAPRDQQDGIRQAVATAARCNLDAVKAVFTLPTREKQPAESGAAAAATTGATGDDGSRPAAAGTSGGRAAEQDAQGDEERAIPHIVIVSCAEVKLAAIRGKSSLKHKAPGIYLEPRRNQQQQRLYKRMRPIWIDLRRKGSETRWVRDDTGVEVGLEARMGKEGPWQRVAMPTKQPAVGRGPPAEPAVDKQPQAAAAAAGAAPMLPPKGSKDGKSQKQRQRSKSTAARGRSATRKNHPNEPAASRGTGKQREQQQQTMQQAAAAGGAAVRKEVGARATAGVSGKGTATGNSSTSEIEPASPT